MWPWGKINRLEAELEEVKRQREFWVTEHAKQRSRSIAFASSLERTESEVAELKSELAQSAKNSDFMASQSRGNADAVAFLLGENKRLEVALTKASKNDQRDAKGRFRKAGT